MTQHTDHIERRSSDTTIQIIADRVGQLHTDVKDVRTGLTETLAEFSKVVQQLVRLEERSITTSDSMERVLKATEKVNERVDKVQAECETKLVALEKRVIALEREQPDVTRMKDWFYKGILGVLCIVGLVVLKQSGIGG